MIYGICHSFAIANTILDINQKPLTLPELERMMFMAQAIWLANPLNEYRALFSDSFSVGEDGPELKSLRDQFTDPHAALYGRAHYTTREEESALMFTNPELGHNKRDDFIRAYLSGLAHQDWKPWTDHADSPYQKAKREGLNEISDQDLARWGKTISSWQHPLAFA